MISTVNLTRRTLAKVAVEHPDDWTQEQLDQAVRFAQIDIAKRADMWDAPDRTAITGTELAVDSTPSDDARAECCCGPRPAPFQLTTDDLVDTVDEEPAETPADPNAQPAPE